MSVHTRQGKTFRIFSFYNNNVQPQIPRYQKAVFKHFGLDVHYVINDEYSHGDFLNYVCRNFTNSDFLIFFDVDCIPVKRKWIDALIADLLYPDSICGAAQTANHLRDGKNLYVSPFFFGISTAYLKKLNYPDMRVTEDMDAGQNLTEQIRLHNGNIHYWWPTSIEEEQWTLYHPKHTKFGLGTTYNNLIYHAFFSRVDLSKRFINKCKIVLPWYIKLYLKITKKKSKQ